MSVRVRIAPSPTGELHVGNARSALFNWLFARRHGGTFIVRVDDTDRVRSEQHYVDDAVVGFRWLGLEWDEGIDVGGPHGTYRQGDRFDRYAAVAESFLESGAAYYDFRSSDELDELRTRAQKEGRHPGFYIRQTDVGLDEARDRIASGETAVIRMVIPQDASVRFADLVRGDMEFTADAIDDFVILRSDGSPTYHLASTVDDVDYEITHVARGEDLLSSTPKHIIITEAMGAERATYAHLPLLFGPDGKKLSKRHGDTSLRAYREGGYLADAMFNYMALLGWSLDAEREVFSREEAVAAFDFDAVSKNPAVFDTTKLKWMNGQYIRAMEPGGFADRAVAAVELDLDRDLDTGERSALEFMAPMIQERIEFVSDIPDAARFLFVDEVTYDDQSWSKVMKGDAARALDAAARHLEGVDAWTTAHIEAALKAMLEAEELSGRKGLQPIRVAVTGSSVSPPLFESLEALGKETTLARLGRAAERLDTAVE